MRQRGVEGLGVLSRQQGAHGFHRTLHGNGHLPPQLSEGQVYSMQTGFDVDGILAGFQQ